MGAYNLADEAFKSNIQIIMFLTGKGCTGKSEVIHGITDLAYTRFGKTLGSAPTGCSADSIHGSTLSVIFNQ